VNDWGGVEVRVKAAAGREARAAEVAEKIKAVLAEYPAAELLGFSLKVVARPRSADGKTRPSYRWAPRYNARGFTEAQERVYQALLRLADARGVVEVASRELQREAEITVGAWSDVARKVISSRYVRVLRLGRGPGVKTVYQVFHEAQVEWPPVPMIPPPAMKAKSIGKVSDGVRAKESAPSVPRAPDAPLIMRSQFEGVATPTRRTTQARYHPKTGTLLNPDAVGSAGRLAVGTPQDRIAALDEAERARIAAQYGAVIKKEAAE
jgi:hypothetical protein